MKRLLLILLLLPVACYGAEPAKKAGLTPPKPATAWSRAATLLVSVYGSDLGDDTTEQIVSSFVAAASKGQNGDKKAPTDGTREEKAAYYLRLLRAIHDDTYLRGEAQKAADAKVEELKAKLPQGT